MVKLNSLKLTFALGFISLSLIGCGSTSSPKSQAQSNRAPLVQVEEQPILEQSPDYYLDEAQRLYAQSQDEMVRNQWLLRAAEAYKQQQGCQQSKKILQISLPFIQDSALRNQAHIILAECLLQTPTLDESLFEQYLSQIDPNISHQNRATQLKITWQMRKGRWLNAAKSMLSIYDGTPIQSEQIWYALQRLPTESLQTASLQSSGLAPWLQLSLIIREYGFEPDALKLAISEWQSRYNEHTLSVFLPQEVSLALNLVPLKQQRTGILLPLTGRLAAQGLAIKEGVLAAYFQQKKPPQFQPSGSDNLGELEYPQVEFFDTNALSIAQLVEATKSLDIVIGPLMKDTLTEFAANAPRSLNIIGLNRIEQTITEAPLDDISPSQEFVDDTLSDETDVPGLRVFFALSPEDEAVQLAQKVASTGARSPIVISQETGAAKRMADTFIMTWKQIADKDSGEPSLATYIDNKSMRSSLTSLLDVEQSRQRIRQLESVTSNQLHSVPRNRRDIDAIILFATPEQTELLNPIVEASLSPFNDKTVPVYASSRSYSQTFSNNSLRDLRNITFTDMPWMLPGHNFMLLQQESEEIWPGRDDTLKRLFALGFDAFSLVNDLPSLVTLPQLSKAGLTGELSVDQQGNVNRVLPFGKITEQDVILIAMD